MDNKVISNVPAYIYDFKDTQAVRNKFITPAKLKVFYKGTTADKRTFTEEFSNELLKTLPLTPVVGYYSEEDEDFLGHNAEQYIYGVVPETAQFGFTEENGTVWAITDVVLYTGRKDNIGDVASKIIGKQHSLEMDPDTIQYDMRVDSDGRVQEIIFKSGSLIGLSVLGDNQKPAFTGSGFFTSQEVQEMINDFVSFKDINLVNNGGFEMNKFENLSENQIKFLESFVTRSYSQIVEEIIRDFYTAMSYDNYYAIDVLTDNSVIAYHYETGKYFKFTKNENGFSEIGEVWQYFLTQSEIDSLTTTDFAADNEEEKEVKEDEDETDCSKNSEEDNSDEKEEGEISEAQEKEDEMDEMKKKRNCSSNDSDVEGAKEDVETEQSKCNKQENSDFAALNDEERQELEAYRNKEKEAIVEKYSKYLTSEEKASYLENLTNYTKESLNSALAVHMSQVIFEQENNQDETIDRGRFFQWGNNSNEDDGLTETERLIKKYANKN